MIRERNGGGGGVADMVDDVHSQFAFSGLRSLRTSMERRPWDVWRITLGSMSSSWPMLRRNLVDFLYW